MRRSELVRKLRRRQSTYLRALATIVVLVGFLTPIVNLLLMSLKTPADVFSANLIPEHPTLAYYLHILDGGAVLHYLTNSIVVTGSTVILATALGTLAAFSLAHSRSAWTGVIVIGIVAVRFYPKVTLVLPYFVLMRDVHLLDTPLAVIIAHVSLALPFVVLVMMQFFRQVPRDCEESAVLDGCSELQMFRFVSLPLAAPGLAVSAILTALTSWNEFLLAAGVTSQKAATLPVFVASFITDKGTDYGSIAATSAVLIAPMLLFMLFAQRYLVRGLTMGAVK